MKKTAQHLSELGGFLYLLDLIFNCWFYSGRSKPLPYNDHNIKNNIAIRLI